MTTMVAKGVFPEDHPLSLGSGGRSAPKPVADFLRTADFIFGVGASLTVSDYEAPIPAGKVAAQLVANEWDVNKDYPVAFPLVGDTRLVLRQLIEEVKRQLGRDGRRGDESVPNAVRDLRQAWMDDWVGRLVSDDVPISPYRLVWDLQRAVDWSKPSPRTTPATRATRCTRSGRRCAPTPTSAGASPRTWATAWRWPWAPSSARPEKTVINMMGDAAFGMIGMDLETAVRNNIGTLTIVMNNGLLGGYEKQLPTATKKYRTRFISGNYYKVAEGLGA